MMQLAEQQSLLPPFTLLGALSQQNVNLLCIAVFVAEGDNAPDACRMADAVSQLLAIQIPQDQVAKKQSMLLPSALSNSHWLMPLSWKFIYGNSGHHGLY